MTAEQVSIFSMIEVINQPSQRMLLDTTFQPIKEHRHKFLYILLDHDIDRLPKRFIGSTESIRNKVQPRSSLQISKGSLCLMQNVIINFIPLSI